MDYHDEDGTSVDWPVTEEGFDPCGLILDKALGLPIDDDPKAQADALRRLADYIENQS